jgi:hypothetical protein
VRAPREDYVERQEEQRQKHAAALKKVRSQPAPAATRRQCTLERVPSLTLADLLGGAKVRARPRRARGARAQAEGRRADGRGAPVAHTAPPTPVTHTQTLAQTLAPEGPPPAPHRAPGGMIFDYPRQVLRVKLPELRRAPVLVVGMSKSPQRLQTAEEGAWCASDLVASSRYNSYWPSLLASFLTVYRV